MLINRKEKYIKMAMIAAGIGSIVIQEFGKLAVDNAPFIRQVATSTALEIGKKTANLILDNNPNFASFMSQFGIHRFGYRNHSTFQQRGKHRRISYMNH